MQDREGYVLFDIHTQYQAVLFAIFRHPANPMRYCIRWVGDVHLLPIDENGSRTAPVCTANQADQLRPSRADQAGQADYFPFTNTEADIPDTVWAGEVAQLQHWFTNLRLELGKQSYLASDHQLDNLRLAGLGRWQRSHTSTIPHNNDPVHDPQYFLEAVTYKHHRNTSLL